jgi:signal transduction histidine kinase
VELRIKPDLFLPLIYGDARSLERALSALLDNAIKFSLENGKVDIALRRRGGQVIVAISDNGIGIKPEMLPRVFDRFYHMDKSGDQLFEGLGLGLAIAKQVVEQHKGRLTVDSTPGKGTTFTMWLNIKSDITANDDIESKRGSTI